MPLSSAIPIDRGDVRVEPLEHWQCRECFVLATHRVVLELRECGEVIVVESQLCAECANIFADRLRGSLPTETPK